MRRSNVRELCSVVDPIYFFHVLHIYQFFFVLFFLLVFKSAKNIKFLFSRSQIAPTSRACPRKFSISNNTSTDAQTAEIRDFSRRLVGYDAGCHIGNELGVTRVFLLLIVVSVFCAFGKIMMYAVFYVVVQTANALDIYSYTLYYYE